MLRQDNVALEMRTQSIEQDLAVNLLSPWLDGPMRQEALLGGGLRPQPSNLAVERFELDAELLGFLFTPPVILKAGEPGELGQQRFMLSVGMLLEPALAHPADVAFFLGPVPRRIADRPGGSQDPRDNGVDVLASFQ